MEISAHTHVLAANKTCSIDNAHLPAGALSNRTSTTGNVKGINPGSDPFPTTEQQETKEKRKKNGLNHRVKEAGSTPRTLIGGRTTPPKPISAVLVMSLLMPIYLRCYSPLHYPAVFLPLVSLSSVALGQVSPPARTFSTSRISRKAR